MDSARRVLREMALCRSHSIPSSTVHIVNVLPPISLLPKMVSPALLRYLLLLSRNARIWNGFEFSHSSFSTTCLQHTQEASILEKYYLCEPHFSFSVTFGEQASIWQRTLSNLSHCSFRRSDRHSSHKVLSSLPQKGRFSRRPRSIPLARFTSIHACASG